MKNFVGTNKPIKLSYSRASQIALSMTQLSQNSVTSEELINYLRRYNETSVLLFSNTSRGNLLSP